MSGRLRLFVSVTSGSLHAAIVPIAALIALEPHIYGPFSILYLVYAFGVSLQLSIVSEAWARAAGVRALSTRDYVAALAWLTVPFGLAALFYGLFTEQLQPLAWLFAFAVAVAIYRSGARYLLVAQRRSSRVLVSDALALVIFTVLLLATISWDPLAAVAIAWLASGAAASATLIIARPRLPTSLVRWIRRNRGEIRPLLMDSLLMDIGAIGTPLILAVPMGAAEFATYRAISNVALPIRIIIDPLRPMIGRRAQSLLTPLAVAGVLLASAAIGVACFVVLNFVLPVLPWRLGTLSVLAGLALPCAIFVFGSAVGTTYAIVCRLTAASTVIAFGRISQTIAVTGLPLGGYIVLGLGGAIWGFVASATIAGLGWLLLALKSGSDRRGDPLAGDAADRR